MQLGATHCDLERLSAAQSDSKQLRATQRNSEWLSAAQSDSERLGAPWRKSVGLGIGKGSPKNDLRDTERPNWSKNINLSPIVAPVFITNRYKMFLDVTRLEENYRQLEISTSRFGAVCHFVIWWGRQDYLRLGVTWRHLNRLEPTQYGSVQLDPTERVNKNMLIIWSRKCWREKKSNKNTLIS